MSSPLIIRISADPNQIEWVSQVNENALTDISGEGSWEQLPKTANQEEVILLVPSTDVTLHTLSMPNISRRKLEQAIPFVLEDKLAGNIEDLHFVFTKISQSDKVVVAIVSNKLMQSWLHMLQEYGLRAKLILPESLLLPEHADGWTIMIDGSMAYLRTDNFQNAAIDVEILSETVKLMLDNRLDNTMQSNDKTQASIQQKIHVYAPDGMSCDVLLKDLNCDIQIHTFIQSAINLLSQNITQALPLNLLQGKFQVVQKINNIMWYSVACLGLVLIVTLFTAKILENNQLQQQSNALEQNIKQHYQQIFPNATTVPSSAQKQIQQKLDELSSNLAKQPFLPLLAHTGEAINQTPGIRLNSFSFSNNVLTINVESNAVNIIDMMTKRLRSKALKIVNSTVSADGSIVKATLAITMSSVRNK